ncbi:MAG TPA: ribonucleoside triphosphate reductase [Chromatiales bacterium]|nr:ribonucleoside triphosphate reductase [Chromatiales bacterium]
MRSATRPASAGRRTVVDVAATVEEYLRRRDWRVRANANQGYSLGGLILNVSGKVIANYWLDHVYPEAVGRAHREADLHIHDLDMLAGYCAGWSLRQLLYEGFNGVPGKVESAPPRHLSSALGQMVNFLGTLQNEWAGAQAFSSFDTYLAPFVRKDGLGYAEVRQCLQEFVYNLNVPSRWGSQTPFTNLTFDWVCPEDLREQVPVIAGREMPFTYGELQAEMDLINRAFIEVMTEGDARGRVFTFPIPTYNITRDFPWEAPNTTLLFEMTAKYGLPYFQNFVSSDLEPGMVRSMCCRLQLDLRELLKRGNGLFGSAEQTGSIGVVTINCARLGYLHRGDEAALYRRLDELLALARDSLEIKRRVVQELMDEGLFPYTRRYLGTLRNHFSTIGVNGVNEMIRNFTGDAHDITTEWGHAFACRLLDHIRARIARFQEETGNLYNLEATPAEGTTYRFAKEDRRRFPGILQAGTPERPYYTNSTQLPVGFTDDPFEALERQEALQRRYTGGTVLHLYMSERISSAEACRRLVRRALERFRVPYLTVTPTFSICPRHGYLAGEHEFCPRCDEELAARKRAAAG